MKARNTETNPETTWGTGERCSYRETRREDASPIAERSMRDCLEEVALNTDLQRE